MAQKKESESNFMPNLNSTSLAFWTDIISFGIDKLDLVDS